jgi:hypothetical protein
MSDFLVFIEMLAWVPTVSEGGWNILRVGSPRSLAKPVARRLKGLRRQGHF